MSNPRLKRRSWDVWAMALAALALFSHPILAGTSPVLPERLDETIMKAGQMSAVAPRRGWAEEDHLHRKIDEARALLEDLRSFAAAAKQVVRMGEMIKDVQLDNDRIRKEIAGHAVNGHDLEEDLVEIEAETRRLTSDVVANWLMTLKLTHLEHAKNDQIISAEDALARSEARLSSLKNERKSRLDVIHSLRAQRAALAAELGRMRRETISTHQDTRAFEDKHQAIETTIRRLRYAIAAQLRTIVAEE